MIKRWLVRSPIICERLQQGDIILDKAGSGGIWGHAAIVDGRLYSSNYGYYVRVIESVDVGVCYGLMDDTRTDERKSYVYRVRGATAGQKKAAVDFCKAQLGKGWELNLTHDYSPSVKSWLCSQLVWAGYKNQGIDIERNGGAGGDPGVSPADITINSTKVNSVNFRNNYK